MKKYPKNKKWNTGIHFISSCIPTHGLDVASGTFFLLFVKSSQDRVGVIWSGVVQEHLFLMCSITDDLDCCFWRLESQKARMFLVDYYYCIILQLCYESTKRAVKHPAFIYLSKSSALFSMSLIGRNSLRSSLVRCCRGTMKPDGSAMLAVLCYLGL